MKKNKLGILGGLGPIASSYLYSLITERTQAATDQEHLDILLYSHASIPDRTQAIIEGREEELSSILLKDLHFLEEAGCTHLVVGCNTAHAFLQDRQSLTSEFIDMISSCALYIREKYPHAKQVGLMSTKGTIISGIYQKVFKDHGLGIILPSEVEQDLLMSMIHSLKAGEKSQTPSFFKVYQSLLSKSDLVLTACTELSLHVRDHLYENVVDSIEITAETVLKTMGVPMRAGVSHGQL